MATERDSRQNLFKNVSRHEVRLSELSIVFSAK